MSDSQYGKVKMICKNKDCLNKAMVYRRYDILREQICSSCKQVLHLYSGGYRKVNQEQIKRELEGLQ